MALRLTDSAPGARPQADKRASLLGRIKTAVFIMTNVHTSVPQSCAPFVPVLKADAADILRVSPKTIDNYIAQGLLPKPRRFGMREMWHPDVFYAHLGQVLLGGGSLAEDAAPPAHVDTEEPRPTPRTAPKPRAVAPLGAGSRLSRRLAEINQRHSA